MSNWLHVCSQSIKGIVQKSVVMVFINLHGVVIENEREAQPVFQVIRMFGLVIFLQSP